MFQRKDVELRKHPKKTSGSRNCTSNISEERKKDVQPQDSKAWEIIKLPRDPRTLYHWSCSKVRGKHVTDLRILEQDGLYTILVSEKVAGARLFRQGWSLEMLNSFLSKLGFPSLPV